jgi:hypothetical protein
VQGSFTCATNQSGITLLLLTPFRELGGLHGHMRPCRCRRIEEGSILHRDGLVQDDNPATRRLELTTFHFMRNSHYDLIAPLGWKGR